MKLLLLLSSIFCSIIFTSCQSADKEIKPTETVAKPKAPSKEEIEAEFKKFKNFYTELNGFKKEAGFKKLGFGKGGKYNKWLLDVQKYGKNPKSKLLINKGVVIGQLEQLGLSYVGSKGEETPATISLNKLFSGAINYIEVKEVKTASGNKVYNELKSNQELFGKWDIIINGKYEYTYEIYKKGNDYTGVTPKGKFKTDKLIKKGNKYNVAGNNYGKYYVINKNKEMTLFDREGELASMGYKAKKHQ